MKTLRKFALLFASALLFSNCATEIAPDNTEDNQNGQVEMTFSASLEEPTKTNFADKYGTTMWSTGDRIQIIGAEGKTNTSAVASNLNTAKTHATFTASVTAGEQLYAIYPATPGGSYSNGQLLMTVPASQDGKFSTANMAVAKCEGANFYFHNAASIFQFVVDMVKYPTAAKVRVDPIVASDKLNGPISIDLSSGLPVVTPKTGGTLSIVADLSTSQGTSTKTSYIAVVPRIYNGVKFTVLEDNNTILRTVTYTGMLGCEPNQMYKFGDLSQHLDPYDFIQPETFTNCSGNGGRDGSYTKPSSILSSASGKCDYADWALSNVYEGKECIAICGDGTNNGFAISPELGISSGWATLSFDVAAVSGSSSLRYMLFIEGKGAIQKQMITCTRAWQNVKVYIQGADSSTKVRFQTYNPNSSFFIDNVKVIDGAPAFNYLNLAAYEVYLEAEETTYLIPGSTNAVVSSGAADFSAIMLPAKGLQMENIPVNNTPDVKKYTVYLSSKVADKVHDGGNSVIVYKRGMAKVFTTPEALEFPVAGGELSAEIGYWNITPQSYDVTCSNSHFTVTREDNMLKVVAAANDTEDPITGNVVITVSDDKYERSCTLAVSQAAEPLVKVSPASVDYVYTGGTYNSQIVTKNFTGTPTITARSSNPTFSTTVSNGYLVVVTPENTTSKAISSTITVTATDGTSTKTCTVVLTVAGKPELTVNPTAFELESAAASTAVVSYETKNFGTGTTTISTSLKVGDLFTVSRSGANITVMAESENTSGEVYKDTLVVTATQGSISRTVLVPFTQKYSVAEPADQTITFPGATAMAYYGTPLTSMVVSGAQTAVTYSISFPEGQAACATINAATGEVTPLAVNGTATVTATAAATADYKTATASYTLTVKRLPAAYTEVEYIEGDGTKYIDAGIQLLSTSRVVIDFAFTVSSTSDNPAGYLYGALEANCTSSAEGSKQFAVNAAGGTYVKYNTKRVKIGDLGTTRHIIDQNRNSVSLDGVSKGTFTSAEYSTPGTMYILWTNKPGTNSLAKAKAKIYSCKVYWNGASLSRDFVPCTYGTQTGLYDLVEGSFYELQ